MQKAAALSCRLRRGGCIFKVKEGRKLQMGMHRGQGEDRATEAGPREGRCEGKGCVVQRRERDGSRGGEKRSDAEKTDERRRMERPTALTGRSHLRAVPS